MGTLRPMQIETLDHVALWVADRDALADFLTTRAYDLLDGSTHRDPTSPANPAQGERR